MASEQGLTGNPAVFAPLGVFSTWNGKSPRAPKEVVGFVTGKPMLVFHDPEHTQAFEHAGGVVFLQQIAGIDALKRYVKRLPDDGWKVIKGTYTSDGGEHVLFDAMYPAKDYNDKAALEEIEAESGTPMRVELPKGAYRLEVLGTWQPDDSTELVAARLVPASSPLSRPARVVSAPAKKLKPAKEMKLEFVDGRFPPPLPSAEGEHAALLSYLHEQEVAFLQKSKLAYAAYEAEEKKVLAGKRKFTSEQVHALASTMLPLDFGEQPPNPDRSRVKATAQWKQQDREFQALSDRSFARYRVWRLMLYMICKNAKLRKAWAKHVKTANHAQYRDWLSQLVKNSG